MAKTSKNKMKFWRRVSVKGYGRKLKRTLAGFNHPAWPSPILLKMFKGVGIETPILDKQREIHKNIDIEEKGEVCEA